MTNTRPDLPYRHANPKLPTDPNILPPVKYQVLTCQGKDLFVGRMKIETPSCGSGHAFILRRFDTGAVSLTTMFRAAFPSASDSDEKREVLWVKSHYDLTGTNGTSKDTSVPRLAGTWVNADTARKLAEEYSIEILIDAVLRSKPDESATYRRSLKGKPEMDIHARDVKMGNNTERSPSPAAKRRREMSPEEKPQTGRLPTPPAPSPPPRRSTRAKSPSLPRSAMPSLTSTMLSKSVSPKKVVVDQKPTKSPLKNRSPAKKEPVEEEEDDDEEEEEEEDDDKENDLHHVASSDLRLQDLADQKVLIENLTRERALREQLEQDQDMDDVKLKRPRTEAEDEKLRFEFREPGAKVEERAVVGTRRVERRLGAREKSLAWGVTAFAFGVGVVTLLPNFF